MKKMIIVATISMMTLSRFLRAIEDTEAPLFDLQTEQFFYCSKQGHEELRNSHHHHHPHRGPRGATGATGPIGPPGPAGPLGSYYADASSQITLQTIVLPNSTPPFTDSVHFSGTNVNSGVSLSLSGNSIVVPAEGNYSINWNITVSLIQSNEVNFHLDLQKNGTTLLHPSPQAKCQIQAGIGLSGTPFTCVAASVIVPLLTNDEISLLLTIDGSEGNITGDGVQVNSAQISTTWSSP